MYRHLTIFLKKSKSGKILVIEISKNLILALLFHLLVVYLTNKQKFGFVGIILCLWAPIIILTFKVNYLTFIVIRGYKVLKPIVGC
jgi:hypothetical protein